MDQLLNEKEMEMVMEAMRTPVSKKHNAPKSIGLLGMEHRARKTLPKLDKYIFRFAESLQKILIRERKSVCDIEIEPSEIVSSVGIRSLVEEKNVRCLMRTAPGDFPAVLLFDLQLVGDIVERLYGGGRKSSKPVSRDMSQLECRMSLKIAEKMAQALSDAFLPAMPMNFSVLHVYERVEPPLYLNDYQPAIKFSFRLQFGGHIGRITLLLPALIFEPLGHASLPKVNSKSWNSWKQDLLGHILDVPLEMTVELGRRALSIEELIHLKTGQVIRLDKYTSHTLDVLIDEYPIFETKPQPKEHHLNLVVNQWRTKGD